jgi:hypothetical protein
VLESLVDDNEQLKRDNEELQTLLCQSREDLHTIREELEEQRVHLYQEGTADIKLGVDLLLNDFRQLSRRPQPYFLYSVVE